jgi:phosphomannomutase
MFHCSLHRSKIGEANVTELMQQMGAVIGGEGNGGVIYPRINFARDSLVGMALVLHLLAESGKTVSQLLDEFPRYTVVKEKMVCPSEKIPAVLRMLRQEYGDYPLDTRDGVKVTLPEGWFLVRGSNTEPIIRVVAESRSDSQAREIVSRIYDRVANCIN